METRFFTNRKEWNDWLKKNHSSFKELWLVFYKKHTGKSGILYDESVEEALCYGWIDSIKRRIDEDRYCLKFTPRKPNSVWSPSNLRRIEKLEHEDRITSAGWRVIGSVETVRKKVQESEIKIPGSLPVNLEKALRQNSRAWNHFQGLADSYRRNYILWITSAKKEETRLRRLSEAIQYLERGLKLPMK